MSSISSSSVSSAKSIEQSPATTAVAVVVTKAVVSRLPNAPVGAAVSFVRRDRSHATFTRPSNFRRRTIAFNKLTTIRSTSFHLPHAVTPRRFFFDEARTFGVRYSFYNVRYILSSKRVVSRLFSIIADARFVAANLVFQ